MSSPPFILSALVMHAIGHPGATPARIEQSVTTASTTQATIGDLGSIAPRFRTEIAPVRIAPMRPTAALEPMEMKNRTRQGQLGGLTWSIGVERQRPWANERLGLRNSEQHRILSLDATLGWDIGENRLIARAGADTDKRPDRAMSGEYAYATTRSVLAGIGWERHGKWQLDFGLRNSTARAKSAPARMIDPVAVAPRSERQAEAQFTLAPLVLHRGTTASFGARMSAGRLTGFGATFANTGKASNQSASLLAQMTF